MGITERDKRDDQFKLGLPRRFRHLDENKSCYEFRNDESEYNKRLNTIVRAETLDVN